MQRRNIEDLSYDGISVCLEAGIGAKTRPGRASQLASNPLFFPSYMLYALLDKAMVEFVMRLSPGIRPALCCRQDFQLGLRDALTFLVDVGQSVVSVRGADENQHALRPLGDGGVLTRREDHVRQVGHSSFQPGVGADCILPDLVGVRRQVHLPIRVAI